MENRFKMARTLHNRHGLQSTKEVASATGITKSLIEDLESNVGKPRNVGYLTIKELAQYYGVSADYLLGLSGTPSIEENIQVACKTTGLTVRAISELKTSKGWGLDMLNCFLENPDFFNFLLDVRRLATAKYRLKVAETDLKETADDRYTKKVMDLTEKQIVQEYWTVEKFKKLQSSTVDELISHKEFQKMVDMVDRAVKKEFNQKEAQNNGEH